MNQFIEIKPREPVGDRSLSGIECVGELFTESVYKVDETSLTKLNFALHLCVFNQYNHY